MKNYFRDCKNLQEVKKLYRDLALKLHPDKGGNTQDMQELNAAYEAVLNNPFFKFRKDSDDTSTEEANRKEFIRYRDVVNQIINLEGLIIEIIGDWVWLSGLTYPYRKQLREIGFLFAPNKVMWFYRPAEYKSANRKPLPIEVIRNKYGSDMIETIPDIKVYIN
jgi:curved DNA-binding protein CbpA